MIRVMMWLMRTLIPMVMWMQALVWSGMICYGQSSSLFRQADARSAPLTIRPTKTTSPDGQSSVIGSVSFFAVKPIPKRIFKVGDIITVIVRQKSYYKHDGTNDLSRELALKAELKDWIRFKSRRLILDTLPAGDPKIDFKIKREFKGEGKKDRKDEVITRISCRVIDIQPNGNLVLEGGPDVIETDGEKQVFTLTGTCRSEDVAADNTILSTQLYECHFKRVSKGSVRDAMRRGWAYRLWDFIRPF